MSTLATNKPLPLLSDSHSFLIHSIKFRPKSYNTILEKELKVMDLAAFTLARDHKMPIRVFNMNKPGALRRVVMGETESKTAFPNGNTDFEGLLI